VFPDTYHDPSSVRQTLGSVLVTSLVALDLLSPPVSVAVWPGAVHGAVVPEAAVHHDNDLRWPEEDVGLAPQVRQGSLMDAETKPERVERLAKPDLDRRVLRPLAAHPDGDLRTGGLYLRPSGCGHRVIDHIASIRPPIDVERAACPATVHDASGLGSGLVTIPALPPVPVPSLLATDLDRNDRDLRALLDQHFADPDALRCAFLARCWPDDAQRRDSTRISLLLGESLDDARVRLGLLWNPQWLLDAGFVSADANGVVLTTVNEPASKAGQIAWEPEIPLPRLDDKAPANLATALAKATAQKRVSIVNKERSIIAGEVAVMALWAADAIPRGIATTDIDLVLSTLSQSGAAARGARWNTGLAYYLELALPGWRVETQVNIRDVFGLHLRNDVVSRSADAVLISPAGKIMAFLSAKYSWRSDRGTEAAQMVFLQRYRPDLPYVLATAEFPRALEISHESIEDQAFHLCGDWVGAWAVTQELPDAGDALPTLAELRVAGRMRVPDGSLLGLHEFVRAVGTAAQYL
jgi:hypothetical protein